MAAGDHRIRGPSDQFCKNRLIGRIVFKIFEQNSLLDISASDVLFRISSHGPPKKSANELLTSNCSKIAALTENIPPKSDRLLAIPL